MRRILIVTAAVNVVALAVASITGTLPAKLLDFELPDLAGQPLIRIVGDEISISNTLFTMWIVIGILIVGAFLLTRDLREQPRSGQNLVELVVQGLADFVEGIGGQQSLRYVPLFGTIFLFVLLSNYLGLVPFVSQPLDLDGRHVEPLRAPTSDYHVNAGLAVTSFVIYQWEGIRKNGVGYFGRFLNLSGFREAGPMKFVMGPTMIIVGTIELFSELFRMLTLTLRLWGNILGGEISIAVMASLLIIPALAFPFIGLELLVGLVQALLFAILVLVYIVLAIESHEEEHGPAHAETATEEAHA